MQQLLFVLLMGNSEGGSDYSLFIMLGLMFVVMYFFMIRPQTKKAKEQRNFLDSIDKGTKVVTIGGIHGKVIKVDETTILVEVDAGIKLKIEKSSISVDMTKALNKPEEKKK